MATAAISNSISRVFSVLHNPDAAISDTSDDDTHVTLHLLPHFTSREAYRDVRGCLFPVSCFTQLAPSPIPTPPIPASCLHQPIAMRQILSNSLGLLIDDDGSVNHLASELLHCFNSTRSLQLYAKFEVVHTMVIFMNAQQEEEEEVDEEDDDDDEEEWLEAIEAFKVDCGFDSGGRTELGTCSICLDDLCCEKKLIRAPCSHLYHESCIESWLERKNNSCPLCRTQVLL